MKTLLQTAAALAFLSFAAAGILLLREAASALAGSNPLLPIVLGLFFVGTACFAGPMLLVASEKCARKEAKRP